MDTISHQIGLGTPKKLMKYMVEFPEFGYLWDQAKKADCRRLEEKLEKMGNMIKGNDDPRKTQIQVDIICRLLKFRDRDRYGDKQSIEVTRIGIGEALDEASKRVINATATNILQIKKPE